MKLPPATDADLVGPPAAEPVPAKPEQPPRQTLVLAAQGAEEVIVSPVELADGRPPEPAADSVPAGGEQ